MLSIIALIAEQKIQEAQRDGAFDNLPGAGKPLELEDDSSVPEELRLAYKMLKNAGCLPPELEEEKEVRNAAELLAGITDEAERYRQIQKLNFLVMKLNARRRRPIDLELNEEYYGKIVANLRVQAKKTGKGEEGEASGGQGA